MLNWFHILWWAFFHGEPVIFKATRRFTVHDENASRIYSPSYILDGEHAIDLDTGELFVGNDGYWYNEQYDNGYRVLKMEKDGKVKSTYPQPRHESDIAFARFQTGEVFYNIEKKRLYYYGGRSIGIRPVVCGNLTPMFVGVSPNLAYFNHY